MTFTYFFRDDLTLKDCWYFRNAVQCKKTKECVKIQQFRCDYKFIVLFADSNHLYFDDSRK